MTSARKVRRLRQSLLAQPAVFVADDLGMSTRKLLPGRNAALPNDMKRAAWSALDLLIATQRTLRDRGAEDAQILLT